MLRSIWRSLTRDPGFTTTAVLTLALGIGANTAMFSVIDGVLLKPLAYREPDRLVSLRVRWEAQAPSKATFSGTHFMTHLLHRSIYDLWRDRAASLESIALIGPGTVNLAGAGQPERLLSAWISSSLFSTLGVQPALGRLFAADEDLYHGAHLAILSHGLWRRRFGADPAVLGRKILLNEEPYEVIGVVSPGFELPIDSADASRFDILLPADPEKTSVYQGWECVARLKPGVTVDQSRAELEAILAHKDNDLSVDFAIVTRLQNNLTARVKRGLSLLMSAVGLVLLIACANLANLLVCRGLTRRKELAVRAALGASRWRIMGQLFRESLGLSLLGGAAGALGAAWILAAILTQLPQELPHLGAISVDGRALVCCLAVTFLCTLLFAVFPAWRFSKADPQEALGQSQRGDTQTRGSEVLRRWLIAAQVALCTMLLIGSGLLLRSFAKILELDSGFETENVLTAEVPFPIIVRNHRAIFTWDNENIGASALRRIATYRAIEERLAATPGVSAAGAVSVLPLSGVRDDYWWPIFLPNERETLDTPFAQIRIATPGYFLAAGIALRSGRLYSDADRWMAVVSESAARQRWPGQDPIGRQVSISHARMGRVAGVVADVRQTELQDPSPPMLYLPPESNLGVDLSFVIRTRLPLDSAAQAIRRAVWEVDANLPVTSIRTMREIVAASTAQRRFQILLLTSFAGVAVLLAALGIYGTLSSSVNQRYREIGIRLALGAQGREVGAMVLRQALAPVVLGIVAGCAGAFVLMRALSGLLYGIGSGDAVTYSAAGALVLLVALASSWLPARRAMRLDPVETMRCE